MASQFYEVPLVPSVNQRLSIQLGNLTYRLFLHWVETGTKLWLLDIADSNGNAIVNGVPLVTGADLLAQYTDMAFPMQLWVLSDGDPAATPTFDNLGQTSHLYVVTGDVPQWSF